MIDCQIIKEDLHLTDDEYLMLYPMALSLYTGYWLWEHACNRVEKSNCDIDINLMNDEEAREHIVDHFEKSLSDINKHPEHQGDCTKESCPCIVCHIEGYFNDARYIRSRL